MQAKWWENALYKTPGLYQSCLSGNTHGDTYLYFAKQNPTRGWRERIQFSYPYLYLYLQACKTCLMSVDYLNRQQFHSLLISLEVPCPEDGWELGFGDKCYKFAAALENWFDARAFCRQEADGDLVIIDSQEENLYIQERAQGGDWWIGKYTHQSQGCGFESRAHRWLGDEQCFKHVDHTGSGFVLFILIFMRFSPTHKAVWPLQACMIVFLF